MQRTFKDSVSAARIPSPKYENSASPAVLNLWDMVSKAERDYRFVGASNGNGLPFFIQGARHPWGRLASNLSKSLEVFGDKKTWFPRAELLPHLAKIMFTTQKLVELVFYPANLHPPPKKKRWFLIDCL